MKGRDREMEDDTTRDGWLGSAAIPGEWLETPRPGMLYTMLQRRERGQLVLRLMRSSLGGRVCALSNAKNLGLRGHGCERGAVHQATSPVIPALDSTDDAGAMGVPGITEGIIPRQLVAQARDRQGTRRRAKIPGVVLLCIALEEFGLYRSQRYRHPGCMHRDCLLLAEHSLPRRPDALCRERPGSGRVRGRGQGEERGHRDR
jgi:hypothetical protein